MKKILVIDDERTVRTVLQRMLEQESFEVMTAVNGLEGIELHANNSFDIIITDLFMPGMDGIETIVNLKKEYPDSKIIAMTGVIGRFHRDFLKSAHLLGANKTLIKPFSKEKLIECVNSL